METYLTKRHQKVTLSTCDSEWIQLYQNVPQGTVFGTLLFNIYVKDMQHTVTEHCSLKQYADETMTFSSNSDAKQAVETLNINVKFLIEFFDSHMLTITTEKTEFKIFWKSNNNAKFNSNRVSVQEQDINVSKLVKYLGVFLQQNLTYKRGSDNYLTENGFRKMKFLHYTRFFPIKACLLLLNALVLSHLQQPVILKKRIAENFLTTLGNI